MQYINLPIIALLISLTLIACGENTSHQPVPDSCMVEEIEDEEEGCIFGVDDPQSIEELDSSEQSNAKSIHPRSVDELEELCGEPCSTAFRISFSTFEGTDHIEGLDFINTIETDLRIATRGITKFSALPNLSSVSSIQINNNTVLESIATFEKIETLRFDLRVEQNSHLRDLTAFQNLRHAGTDGDEGLDGARLNVTFNDSLINLKGLDNVETAFFVRINFNDSLESLDGFESLAEIEGIQVENNKNLSNIDGLQSLHTVHRYIDFKDLPKLRGCEIDAFIDGLDDPPDIINISGVSDEACD